MFRKVTKNLENFHVVVERGAILEFKTNYILVI